MKRVISFVLTMVMLCLSLCVLAEEEPKKADDFLYTVTGDEVTICGYEGTQAEVTIPALIDGKSVVGIDSFAFSDCETLTSVTVPESVKHIGYVAFSGCTNLTNLILPEQPLYLDNNILRNTALYNDPNNWDNGVLYVGKHLIDAQSSVTGDFAIREGTLSTAYTAFSDASITTVLLPASLTVLENGNPPFGNQNQLTAILVHEDNPAFTSVDGVLFSKDQKTLFRYPAAKAATEYTIPKGTVSLQEECMAGVSALQSVVVPDTVSYIGERAFIDCGSLTNITLPDCPIFIEGLAFQATGYANNEANWENNILYIGKHLVQGGQYEFSGSVNVKSGTLSISGRAFSSADVSGLSLPESLKIIGPGAFYSCDDISYLSLPEGLEIIGAEAFAYCSKLSGTLMPKSLTQIGRCAIGTTTDDPPVVLDGFRLSGYADSVAQVYAREHGIPFNVVSDQQPDEPQDPEVPVDPDDPETPVDPEIPVEPDLPTDITTPTDITPTDVALGDLTGDETIDAKDALVVLKVAVGKVQMTEEQAKIAELNGDGTVDAKDALLILKIAVGKIDAFPVEQ